MFLYVCAGTAHSWPLESQPVVQQACAQHIVSLTINMAVRSNHCASIFGLPNLTYLSLRISRTLRADDRHIAEGMTALQCLQHLTLSSRNVEATLPNLDLSPLVTLTRMELVHFIGCFSVAANVRSLRYLHLLALDRPNRIILQRVRSLSSLELLHVNETALGPEELEAFRHLPRLQQLHLEALPYDTSALFPDGLDGLCKAVGRLSWLTSLTINSCG